MGCGLILVSRLAIPQMKYRRVVNEEGTPFQGLVAGNKIYLNRTNGMTSMKLTLTP